MGCCVSGFHFRLFDSITDAPPQAEIHERFQRFCANTFDTPGEAHTGDWVQTDIQGRVVAHGYRLWAIVEGESAQDPQFVERVKRRFRRWLDRTWSTSVTFKLETEFAAEWSPPERG